MISKFLTGTSWSNESLSTISVFARAGLVLQPDEEQRVEGVHGRHEEGLAVPVVRGAA